MLEVDHISERQFSISKGVDPTAQKFKRVLVIGLGQIGLPVAKYIQEPMMYFLQ